MACDELLQHTSCILLRSLNLHPPSPSCHNIQVWCLPYCSCRELCNLKTIVEKHHKQVNLVFSMFRPMSIIKTLENSQPAHFNHLSKSFNILQSSFTKSSFSRKTLAIYEIQPHQPTLKLGKPNILHVNLPSTY